jgi:FkbM family methyltransferase
LLKEYLIEDISFYDNDIVIDCGANIGDFFLCFDKKIKYVGIEPSPSEFLNLQQNVQSQIILNKALWNKSNEVLKFYIASEEADSSLIEIKNYEKIEEVQTITLDDLIDELKQNIKLIKLEAEGAEPEILQGLKKNINKVNYITIDAGFERGLKLESTLVPCVNYLLSNNFTLLDYGHERVTLKFINKNFKGN